MIRCPHCGELLYCSRCDEPLENQNEMTNCAACGEEMCLVCAPVMSASYYYCSERCRKEDEDE